MADNQPGLQNSTTLGGADGVTGIFPPPLLREAAPPAKLLRESAPPAKLLRKPASPVILLQEGHKQANISPGILLCVKQDSRNLHPGLLFPARVRNNASPCSVDQLSQELPSPSPQVTLPLLAC